MFMKKILAAVLALTLVLSCAPVALAAEPDVPLTRGEVLEMLLNAADDYNPGVQKSDILQGYPDGTLREEGATPRSRRCAGKWWSITTAGRSRPDYQTLYRSAAGTWRLAASREPVALHALTNIHATDVLRSQLPLQSCDQFYEAFGITEGGGMWIPPEERVSVW